MDLWNKFKAMVQKVVEWALPAMVGVHLGASLQASLLSIGVNAGVAMACGIFMAVIVAWALFALIRQLIAEGQTPAQAIAKAAA